MFGSYDVILGNMCSIDFAAGLLSLLVCHSVNFSRDDFS